MMFLDHRLRIITTFLTWNISKLRNSIYIITNGSVLESITFYHRKENTKINAFSRIPPYFLKRAQQRLQKSKASFPRTPQLLSNSFLMVSKSNLEHFFRENDNRQQFLNNIDKCYTKQYGFLLSLKEKVYEQLHYVFFL